MELKFEQKYKEHVGQKSSNRTFMELKFEQLNVPITQPEVLIVPLWN